MNIIIFGASSGIGRELAEQYLAAGHHVTVTGRREHLLREIQERYPEQVVVRKHDVTDYADTDVFFDELEQSSEPVDFIIYSSGTGKPNYDLDWEIEKNIIETNVLGAVKVMTRAWQLFKKQSYGHLAAISSVAGVRGNRHVPAYFASKAFLNNYMESLWMKARRSKSDIHVTNIIPGFVDTEMAMGKTFWMASTQKAARQIRNALTRKKKLVYITRRWALVAALMRIIPARWLMSAT